MDEDEETRSHGADVAANAEELLDPVAQDEDVLEPWYRQAIRKIESLPKNQRGSDKSWVFRCIRADAEHFAKARRK